MSQVNIPEGEISLNERNSITGSSSLHNLTGTRARFHPVRIKALLSLFESEDDDTEPRDSDDNSDTESLQALPDDDDDDNKAPGSLRDEDPPPKHFANIILDNDTGVSTKRNFSTSEPIPNNFEGNKFEEVKRISRNSNSFESNNSALVSSMRKVTLAAPLFKQVSNNVDNVDSNKETIFTPRGSIGSAKPRMCNQNSVLSDMKLEGRQENLIDFDTQCKAKEPVYNSDMETPMKRATTVTNDHNSSCLGMKKALETPQTKLNEYSQSAAETPAAIFSHWSRNNFFQTPTHNPMIMAKKDGHMNHQMQDVRLEPHRFCTSQNRVVRRPLSEAMHVNQGSSINVNSNNHVAEGQSVGKGSLLTKENCPMDNNRGIKGKVANKLAQSLQESNRQSVAAFSSMKDEKLTSRTCLEMGQTVPPVSVEQRDYGFPDKRVANASREACDNDQVLPNRSDGILNSKNNNFGVDSWSSGRSGAMLPNSNGQDMNLPLPANCESNLGNVQFSVSSKTTDKKYGKMINVKGSDYLVLGKLGQGMSGEVLRVQEIKTGELRAIKCVDLSCIEKETAQGCLEEVSMLDRLRAPCIINMFTYEIKSHLLYVVMEMGDTDLSKLLKSLSKEKQLPLTMILYYWTEMLTAVKHIHDHGVIHSDLKPANFLLVRGRLKLIDFGIASTVNADMTSVVKNTSLGTLNYISPEAINDIGGNGDSPNANNQYKINFRSDVWSLGCILYSMVYGQTPFQHIRANWAKVNAITNPNQKIAFPPPESTTRRGYTAPPPFLVDVMRRCLQHDRKARPTVSQLLQIPYVGCNCPPASSLPSIPPSILSKIKHSLEESEWRQLLEALERRKPLQ